MENVLLEYAIPDIVNIILNYASTDYRKTQKKLQRYVIPDISDLILGYVYHKHDITQLERAEGEKKHNGDRCLICQQKFYKCYKFPFINIRLYILPCHHKFHAHCILDNTEKARHNLLFTTGNNIKCPLCSTFIKHKEIKSMKHVEYDDENCLSRKHSTISYGEYSGCIFQLITSGGNRDRILMSTELLNKRLRLIKKNREKENQYISDRLPTLLDIEKASISRINTYSKPLSGVDHEIPSTFQVQVH